MNNVSFWITRIKIILHKYCDIQPNSLALSSLCHLQSDYFGTILLWLNLGCSVPYWIPCWEFRVDQERLIVPLRNSRVQGGSASVQRLSADWSPMRLLGKIGRPLVLDSVLDLRLSMAPILESPHHNCILIWSPWNISSVQLNKFVITAS